MAHGSSYLPTREADLLGWSANVAALLTASPETYGISIPQAAEYQTLHDAFANAYAAVNGPNRGPVATQTKNTAKNKLKEEARKLVRIIQAAPGTTDTMRVQLQITVPDVEPTPVPRPTLAPQIDMLPPVVRSLKIRLHNKATLGHKGKPEGVAGALLFSYVGATPPSVQETQLWKYEANMTTTSETITFPPDVPSGATVWVTAFWYNPRGESGPSASPHYALLPGEMAQAA